MTPSSEIIIADKFNTTIEKLFEEWCSNSRMSPGINSETKNSFSLAVFE